MCSSSWSGWLGDGPGLRARDLLQWVGVVWFFAPALVWNFGRDFPGELLVSLSDGGLTYGTSDQCVSLSLIDAGGVQPLS